MLAYYTLFSMSKNLYEISFIIMGHRPDRFQQPLAGPERLPGKGLSQ